MKRSGIAAAAILGMAVWYPTAFAQRTPDPKPDPPRTATVRPTSPAATTLTAPLPTVPPGGTTGRGRTDPVPPPGTPTDLRLRSTPLDTTPQPPRILPPQTPAAANSAMPALPDLPVEENAEPGQLVIFAGDAKGFEQALRQLAGEFGATVSRIDRLPTFDAAFAVLQFAPGKPVGPLRAEMARRMPDWIIEPNTRFFFMQAGATRPRLYATAAIRLPADAAFARGVRIGLMDSTVERVAALAGARIVQREFVPHDLAGSSEHGTALASLIAGDLREAGFFGIARGSTLAVAAVMRDADKDAGLAARTNIGLLAPALDWLLAQRVQVLNLSLGGGANAILERLVREILKRDVAVVAAAGNGGPAAPAVYPAAYPGVIAVTAADSANQVYAQANHGSYLMLTAPGVDVWVPLGGAGRYVSGTSFAAALVSGAIAVNLARNVRTAGLAADMCRHASDLGDPGRDPVFGCGLLQVARPSTP